jgi:hypothetical protein
VGRGVGTRHEDDMGERRVAAPPLELMTLVPENVKHDDFKGLMLIPWWPRQNLFHKLSD